MPVPMFNVINGGAHSNNNIEIQEFMILPVGAESFAQALRMGSEIYHNLGNIIKERGLSSAVGDEGGYAPDLHDDEEALDLLVEAIERSTYNTNDVKIALDVASSEWHTGKDYKMTKSGRIYSSDELCEYYRNLLDKYPIMSIEDGVGEEDFDGWRALTDALGGEIMLVGDDLFVTNEKRVKKGMEIGIANSVLIKPNQIGTLSETLNVISLCGKNGYKYIISHRSGETEDSFIADLAVAVGAPYIKSGAPCRSERLSKYNRLLAIEKELYC